MQLRCLYSAASSGDSFDLGCEVREKLIDFLQREHPEALPRPRAEVAGSDVPAQKTAGEKRKLVRQAASGA